MLVQIAEFVVVPRWFSEVLGETSLFGEELQFPWSRFAEQCNKLAVVGLVGGMVEAEVIHVERKRSITVLFDQLPHLVHVSRHTVGRHAHYFVFALNHFKPEECGERAIQQPDRVREFDLLQQTDVASVADPIGSGNPFPNSINRKNGSFVEWRTQVSARRMRQVMFTKQYLFLTYAEFRLERAADPQFIDHP